MTDQTNQLIFPDLEYGVPSGVTHAHATTEQLHRTLAMEVQAGVVHLTKDFDTVDDLTEDADGGRGILIRARTCDGTWHEIIISSHAIPDTVARATNRSLYLDVIETGMMPPEMADIMDEGTKLRYSFTITGDPKGFKVPTEAQLHHLRSMMASIPDGDDA